MIRLEASSAHGSTGRINAAQVLPEEGVDREVPRPRSGERDGPRNREVLRQIWG